MSLRPGQVADLLGYMGYLSVHRFLVEGHSFQLGHQLIDRCIKHFIGLSLSRYELLHETLQV